MQPSQLIKLFEDKLKDLYWAEKNRKPNYKTGTGTQS